MAITPLEMYTMVPKSQEAAHVRLGEQARENAQQTAGMQHLDKNISDNRERTVAATRSENDEYRYDAKEGGNGHYTAHQDSHREKKEEQTEKDDHIRNMTDHPGGIDFRI
ncbi:MAG: hypothetical protein K6G81_10165 [Lachnospiraceae bacterium]|nr:hypothetical protein [Lachnospiraceae bacterium]